MRYETLVNSSVPCSTVTLERCPIIELIELDDADKDDDLLVKGLPDYDAIEQSIYNLEQMIANFNTNFGSLAFDDH